MFCHLLLKGSVTTASGKGCYHPV